LDPQLCSTWKVIGIDLIESFENIEILSAPPVLLKQSGMQNQLTEFLPDGWGDLWGIKEPRIMKNTPSDHHPIEVVPGAERLTLSN